VFWAILIFANGTALLLFNQTLVGTLYNLTLPAPPLSAPVVYNNMTPVPAVLTGDVLTVPVLGHALITVKYVPRTRVVDGALAFNVTEGYYVIWAERGVLLLPTLQIINYTIDKNAIVLIAKGPGTVAYTLQGTGPIPTATATTTTTPTPLPAQTQQTTASPSTTSAAPIQQPPPAATTSTIQSPSPTPGAAPSGGGLQEGLNWLPAAVAGVSVAVAGAAYAMLRNRGKKSGNGLNETDSVVLDYVRRTGGVYEADIARALGLPRTTVFKAVRRLEREGLVKVEKRNGRNYVKPR
jgi:uncharacterized membrane protein